MSMYIGEWWIDNFKFEYILLIYLRAHIGKVNKFLLAGNDFLKHHTARQINLVWKNPQAV